MQRDAALRADVLSSDLVLADGMAVVWASRILGRPLPERVAGIDLMMGMLARGERARLSGLLSRAPRRTSWRSRRRSHQAANTRA